MFDINTKTTDYMSIVLTNTCNLCCPFCIDQQSKGQVQELSMSHLEQALQFAANNQMKDILLVGGEPTLHPQIIEIARSCHDRKFRVIMTTNCQNIALLYTLDPFVDCFNFSYYGQPMPDTAVFQHADVTISTLIHQKQLQTKQLLDDFIDTHAEKHITLKFSTLCLTNAFTKENQIVPYLDELPGPRMRLFDEIGGQIYRNCVIKRYDKIYNQNAPQSYKCLVDGTIGTQWE